MGLTETCWLLREVRRLASRRVAAYVEWGQFRTAKRGLFLWEAFVSGKSKGLSHERDAEIGARAFVASLPDIVTSVHASDVYSLIGASLLRTRWRRDLAVLRKPCIVVKA